MALPLSFTLLAAMVFTCADHSQKQSRNSSAGPTAVPIDLPKKVDSPKIETDTSKSASFTTSMFPSFPAEWVHQPHAIGALNGKNLFRQAIATGTVSAFASDGVNPQSAIYSMRHNKTFMVYPGGAKRVTQQMLADFYSTENSSVNPFIIVFDHGTNQYSGPFKLANVGKLNDQHNYPIIEEDSNGYIHVFYTYHASTGSTVANYRNITHFTSKWPGNVSHWDISEIPGTEYHTYAQIVKDRKNRFHIFYRKSDDSHGEFYFRSAMHTVSTDDGRSWSTPREFIRPPTRYESAAGGAGWNTIYQRSHYLDPYLDRIWITFRESQFHNQAVNRYFIAYMSTEDGTLHTAGNEAIGQVINWQQLDGMPNLQFFSYGGVHEQNKKFAEGKDLLLFRGPGEVPDLLITRYFSPHAVGSNEYYNTGYYQTNQLRFQAERGWENLGVPAAFANQQVVTSASQAFQGQSYLFFSKHGSVDANYQVAFDRISFLGRVLSLDPLSIEQVPLFADAQRDWQSNGASNFLFIAGPNDVMGLTFVPKYDWWLGTKNLTELVKASGARNTWRDLPPIGASYIVMENGSGARADSVTESKPESDMFCDVAQNGPGPSCDSWQNIQINGCSLQDWQAGAAKCRSTSSEAYAWIHVGSDRASHMRFINVAATQSCDSVSMDDAGWSHWEEYASFAHWKLSDGTGDKKVCGQLRTTCGVNGRSVSSRVCGAVTH